MLNRAILRKPACVGGGVSALPGRDEVFLPPFFIGKFSFEKISALLGRGLAGSPAPGVTRRNISGVSPAVLVDRPPYTGARRPRPTPGRAQPTTYGVIFRWRRARIRKDSVKICVTRFLPFVPRPLTKRKQKPGRPLQLARASCHLHCRILE